MTDYIATARRRMRQIAHRTGAARDVAMLALMMATAASLKQIVRVPGWPDPTEEHST